jgi:tetratricopeptide (TPR) repeat protein
MGEHQTTSAGSDSADRIERMLLDDGIEAALEAADELADDRGAWDRGLAVLEAHGFVPGMAVWTAAMRSHFPDDVRLAAANAWTTTHTDGAEAGLPLWLAAMTQFPNEAEMRRGLAAALGLLGRRDDEDAVLEGGVRDFPHEPLLHLAWAGCAAERGDFRAAIHRYEYARGAFPESLPFYLGVGDMLSRLGQHQDAYILLCQTAAAFDDASHVEPTIAIIRDRAAQAGVTLRDEIVDVQERVAPEPPPATDEPEPEPEPDPTLSPAWSMLRGETEVTEEARAAFVPEPAPQPEPPKKRGLLGRMFGR